MPYATGSLPTPLQKLPGLSEAYVSGYCSTYKDVKDVAVQGELVVARQDDGQGKAYVYFFGVSGSGVFFAGPFKPSNGHYFDTGSGVPVEELFGASPPPKGKPL